MERIEEISPNSTRRIYSPCEDPDVAVELERPMGPQRQLVWRDDEAPEPAPPAASLAKSRCTQVLFGGHQKTKAS